MTKSDHIGIRFGHKTSKPFFDKNYQIDLCEHASKKGFKWRIELKGMDHDFNFVVGQNRDPMHAFQLYPNGGINIGLYQIKI